MAAPVFLDIDRVIRGDGNKRTGAASVIIFLAMNDWELEADEAGLVKMTLSVACGNAGKSEITEFFRSRAHPSPPDHG